MTTAVAQAVFVDAQPGVAGTATRGPLGFLRAVINHCSFNASLKYGLVKTVDDLSEYLKIREEVGLEYLFARAVFVGCIEPIAGHHAVYDVLRQKFESFDRRYQELVVTQHDLPLLPREANIQRLIAIVGSRKAELMRAFHVAEAHDVDGPWIRSPEKAELFAVLTKTLTGHVERRG